MASNESSCTSNDESNSFIVDSIASLTSNESYNSIIEESITSNNVEIDKSTFSDSLLSNSNASLDAAVEKRNVFESSDEESDIHFKNRLSSKKKIYYSSSDDDSLEPNTPTKSNENVFVEATSALNHSENELFSANSSSAECKVEKNIVKVSLTDSLNHLNQNGQSIVNISENLVVESSSNVDNNADTNVKDSNSFSNVLNHLYKRADNSIKRPSGQNVSEENIVNISKNSTEESPSQVDSSEDELFPIEPYSGPFQSKQNTLKDDSVHANHVITLSDDENNINLVNTSPSNKDVSQTEYDTQKELVETLRKQLTTSQNLIVSFDTSKLPDKGERLYKQHSLLEEKLEKAEEAFNSMVVGKVYAVQQAKNAINWSNIEAAASSVQPRTFGQQAMQTLNQQKALTLETLEHIHKSLETCPTESKLSEDPSGLKIELMPHQKHALDWLIWREKQKPSGGILADDMGLGKTLTMISLMLKSLELEEDESFNDSQSEDASQPKYDGGTLIVCPASLLNHWEHEVQNKLKRGKISIELFHGQNRENRPKKLSKYDMIITTYAVANVDFKKEGILSRIKWRRIILDEAHTIRNYKSQTAVAVCELSAKSRWALTGTPVHNKELDLYSLLKFLRCSPFDDLAVWKRWVANKDAGGQERLNTVISSLLLRRTKAELITKGSLQQMPEKEWKLLEIHLDKPEMDVYQRVLVLSRSLFAQFLHQRAEKNSEVYSVNNYNATSDPNGEYYKMHKKLVRMNRVKIVKQHEILVLLLKLRQLCCHPHLIKNSLDLEENKELAGQDEMDIIHQLDNLNLNDSDRGEPLDINQESVSASEAVGNVINPDNVIFSAHHVSSKIKAVLKLIKEEVLPTDDKCIIVSQWTSLLDLVAINLKKENVIFDKLDGRVQVNKRINIVDNINNPSSPTKILLLSLTAGGVGLNLVGANHLLLLDLHWNPQLELQAQDRIYRMGQTKPVFIYKFVTCDTIEQRVQDLQEKKKNMASAMLSGANMQQAKLSLNDLKMLFNM